MRVGFACVTLCIILSFLAPGIALSPGKSEEATKEFKEAVELIKSGNNSLSSNCDDAAYCLYDSAVTRLNGIKGKYPDWNREKVMKQIKLTLDAKKRLEGNTTKKLEEMKQGRFRYLVWQRQVLILDRLSKLMDKLEKMEEEQDENQEIIKDIKQSLSN